jgi:hypothetical protein
LQMADNYGVHVDVESDPPYVTNIFMHLQSTTTQVPGDDLGAKTSGAAIADDKRTCSPF